MCYARRSTVLSLFVIVALLLGSACQPVVSPPVTEPPPPQGLRPDAPAYGMHGPYAVGTREFVIETPERSTPVTIWIPRETPG